MGTLWSSFSAVDSLGASVWQRDWACNLASLYPLGAQLCCANIPQGVLQMQAVVGDRLAHPCR